jgi:hypothetical protein
VLERLERLLPGHKVLSRGRSALVPDTLGYVDRVRDHSHDEGGVQSAEQARPLRAAELVVRPALPLLELAVDDHLVHDDAEVSETCCQACCTRGVRDDDAVCSGVERGCIRVLVEVLDVGIRSVFFFNCRGILPLLLAGDLDILVS